VRGGPQIGHSSKGSGRRPSAGVTSAEVPAMRRHLIRALLALAPAVAMAVDLGTKWR
jgi:hypothetical protein